MRAEEKIRLRLTGSPNGVVAFQHEGPGVIRQIFPDKGQPVSVTFDQRGDEIIVRCPNCEKDLGHFDAKYGRGIGMQVRTIYETAILHRCQ